MLPLCRHISLRFCGVTFIIRVCAESFKIRDCEEKLAFRIKVSEVHVVESGSQRPTGLHVPDLLHQLELRVPAESQFLEQD